MAFSGCAERRRLPGNAQLLKSIASLGKNIAALKKRCTEARIPVIYVNDNRGKWRSDFFVVLSHCLRSDSPGCPMVNQLIPEAADYIVLKPKHFAFYATPLDTLFSYLKVKTVILAGLITNACILSTASELYVRDLDVYVPSDCVAAPIKRAHRYALELMSISFDVDTTSSTKRNLPKISKTARG
ncbi:MAG TPA: cysteine hydrolase [Methylomirabilota bacterium]|nr:cysteine hydrolase [Methylomirabilota bacterium]